MNRHELPSQLDYEFRQLEHNKIGGNGMNLYELSTGCARIHYELEQLETKEAFEDGVSARGKLLELFDALDEFDKDFDIKVENYVRVIFDFEAEADAIKYEIERLKGRLTVRNNRVKYLKLGIKDALLRADVKKVETEFMTARIQKPRERLEIDEELIEEWPDEIRSVTTYTQTLCDKTAIKTNFSENVRRGDLAGAEFVMGEPILVIK